ncbi:type I restriction enzyme, S subunit [Reichenbachiella agariperforans]|uniref:Type I restriction enzyme, S subunit n=1 Tax=Reichenbachiella agariperforans TaxID=156994 RepID=A0A1M6KT34_REIAG|nr:restriction endonuclease subunit S [Reichenbachiella agariperforans]SHJ62042.1 type I restriction enzyme, S subunit [Reichenbachiella agariperforans]
MEAVANKKEVSLIPKLRFKEFEGEWNNLLLGELFTFKNGLNSDKDKYGSGVKFINVLDIINETPITYDSIIGSVEVSEKEFKKNEVGYGDVLFQRSSETREEVGQANIYIDKNQSAVFGGFVIRGKGKLDYDPLFMNYLLKTSPARKEITTKSGGSTRYNVGQDSLSSVLIKTTTLPEQQKIASFLTAVDEKIQQLTRKKSLLAQYKKGVMQKLFAQEIRFKDYNGNNYPDWEEIGIGKHIELISGIAIKGPEMVDEKIGTPILRGINITEGFVRHSVEIDKYFIGSIDKLDKYVLKTGDLVLGMDGSKVGKNCAIISKRDEGSILIQRVARIRTKETASLEYIYQHIFSSRFHKYVDVVNTSSGIPHISAKQINEFMIPFPCLEEQQKIATYLSSLDQKIETVNHQITHTQTFKKGLLQGMFV